MQVDLRKNLQDLSEKEVDERQTLRYDKVNKSQSFGSNCRPSSQSRKISIGITINKKKPEVIEQDEAKFPNAERMNINKDTSMDVGKKGDCPTKATNGKQSEPTEQVTSAYITKLFLHHDLPISETVHCLQQASSRPATGGRQKKLKRVKVAELAQSVQFIANQTSILQSGENIQKKFTDTIYTRKGGRNGSQDHGGEFTFPTAEEEKISEKVVVEDKTDNRTETLRMKLCQILGTVSSPKSQPSNSHAQEIGAEKLKPEHSFVQIGGSDDRPRHNSDTIETDSESPKQHAKRPWTRSFNRKRASAIAPQKNTKPGQSSGTKQKHQMNKYFNQRRSKKLDGAINFGSLMSKQKKNQRKSCTIGPRKFSFSPKDNADEPQQSKNNSESPLHAGKTSSLGHKEDSFHGCSSEEKRENFERNNRNQDKCFNQLSDLKSMNQRGDSPSSARTKDHEEDCDNPSKENIVEPPDEFQSPTFAFRTPNLSPSPCCTPKAVQVDQDLHSPELEDRRFSVGSICSFGTLKTSKLACSRSDTDTDTDSPADAQKPQDFSHRKPSHLEEREDVEDDVAKFSSENEEPGSFDAGSPLINEYGKRNNSPQSHTIKNLSSMHCPTNRLHDHQGVTIDEFSPPLRSPRDIGKRDWFEEPSEQNQEDELARAVTTFGFALENFRRKMDLATKKTSSDILVSVSEGIHLQLQNVESQIQKDMVKLTSLSKTKRKRLEIRFEEQQEQLNLIHQQMKEGIHHHLQNCQNTLEFLEAHQIELKGTIKKQRTSHQKLISQVEETVQIQLNDAQKRITTVHESARKKMLQLKRIIAEFLKEDSVD